MSSSIVYFGAQPEPSQSISPELLDQGINYIRLRPDQVRWHGAPEIVQPNFSIYKCNLAAFCYAAIEKKPVPAFASKFWSISYQGRILPLPMPELVFSFAFALPFEVADELEKNGARHTMIRGKPAMTIPIKDIETVRLIRSKKPIEVTPCIEETTNIRSFIHLTAINRILTVFLKVHQYPAFKDKDHLDEFTKDILAVFEKEVDVPMVEGGAITKPVEVVQDIGLFRAVNPDCVKYHVHLPVPFESSSAYFDPVNLELDSDGLVFGFNSDLAIFDQKTVPSVLKTFFYGFLGDNEDEASELFVDICSSWGVLYKTEAGKVLSHIFKVIEMALELQTRVMPLFSEGKYVGCVMAGGGYHISVMDHMYYPVSSTDVKTALIKVNPHRNALLRILQKVNFPDDGHDEDERMENTERMWDLKDLLDTLPLKGGDLARVAVEKDARYLRFAGERPLPTTANNISSVCSYIADPSKNIRDLPLHYSQLFSQKRSHLCWSSFGSFAPSFRIPSGKAMSLQGPFRTTVKSSVPDKRFEAKEVRKISCLLVSLDIALRHLDDLMEKKEVLNPFGNSRVPVSESNINKVFEGESTVMILDSLRRVCQVKVTDAPGPSKGKRRADGEGEGGSGRKRNRVTDL